MGVAGFGGEVERRGRKYLQYLKAITRPTTYVRFRKVLQYFTDFLAGYGTASPKLSQISFQLIEEYKQERSKAVKPSTVNIELKVLRALYNFAIQCKCARENPVSKVDFFRGVLFSSYGWTVSAVSAPGNESTILRPATGPILSNIVTGPILGGRVMVKLTG